MDAGIHVSNQDQDVTRAQIKHTFIVHALVFAFIHRFCVMDILNVNLAKMKM